MDAGVAQACKAAELARRLSETEVFLLVESERFPKSDDQRAFAPDAFLAISIVKRVAEGRRGVEKAIEGLIKKGFLNRLGGLVHATQNGNTVKHAFRDVRSALSLRGIDPAELRTVRFVVTLRKEIGRLCDEQRRNRSAQSLT